MIIKNNELQKLKATKCNLYLLYGENRGFKNQFIYENLSSEFKENIFKYNESEIFNDYNDFISSILNKSFFEEKKLYIISNVPEKILKLVEDFLSSNIEDITIIFVASNPPFLSFFAFLVNFLKFNKLRQEQKKILGKLAHTAIVMFSLLM